VPVDSQLFAESTLLCSSGEIGIWTSSVHSIGVLDGFLDVDLHTLLDVSIYKQRHHILPFTAAKEENHPQVPFLFLLIRDSTRQYARPNQERIHLARGLTAFANGRHDQRLAAARVAR
jgi:hypothetical protein